MSAKSVCDYSGHWTGRFQGTNYGGFSLELTQNGRDVVGAAQFAEFEHGQYAYSVSGEAGTELRLHLEATTRASGLNLGAVDVFGAIDREGRLVGRWTSSIGTAGAFSAERHRFPGAEAESREPTSQSSEMDHPEGPLVFISYSHKDQRWLEAVTEQLKSLKRRRALDCWTDREIAPGTHWQQEIERRLNTAKVAVLLVSPAFLGSDFIANRELPMLLERAHRGDLKVLWIPVSASMYEQSDISRYQAASDPNRPLDTLRKAQRNQVLVKICTDILTAAGAAGSTPELTAKRDYGSSDAAAIRPMVMIVYRHDGWYVENKGRGAALNLILAQKYVKGPHKGEWFNPVRIPALSPGEELHLTWLGHVNDTGLGASYEDEDGRPFTSLTGNDLTRVVRDKMLPSFAEHEIRRHWEFFR